MKINKRQLEFIVHLERCNGMYINQVDFSKYPKSLIEALKGKGLIEEVNSILKSTTGG